MESNHRIGALQTPALATWRHRLAFMDVPKTFFQTPVGRFLKIPVTNIRYWGKLQVRN
jgi:hypothetical protein